MAKKGDNTSTTTSSANPQAAAAYSNLLNRAQGVADTPYTPYGGELVAPMNAQQQTGVANLNANAYYALPYIQEAAGLARSGASPLTTEQIQHYMSPYTQSVVDATQRQFNEQNAQQQQQVLGNAAAQGALGGDRVGVTQALLANQQQLAQAPVISGLYDKGYTTGLNTAITEQQAQAQGAYSLGNLGVSGENMGLAGANAQIGAGTLEQQIQQAKDQAAYEQFMNQMAYPFQTTQWLSGIDTGVGSQMGGTSTTTGPRPSTAGQIGGALTSGVGLLGATGAFGSAGWLLPAMAMMARGGAVPSAGVANRPPTIPESDDTLRLQQQQLLAGHRRVHHFPEGTPELPVPQGMRRTQNDSGVFHYDPKRIDEHQIHHLAAHGRENEMLDLGPYSKDEILHRLHGGEIPVAIVERHPNGTEVRAAAGTHLTAPHQLAAMHRTKSPGHRVGLEDPRETIGARLRAHGGRLQGFDGGAPAPQQQRPVGRPFTGMPYGGGRPWVPPAEIARGRGLPQPAGIAPAEDNLAKQAKQIGSLANLINKGDTAAPAEEPEMARGGGVANRGYADGGAPYGGGRGWVPTMALTAGHGAPPPPGLAPPAGGPGAGGLGGLADAMKMTNANNRRVVTNVPNSPEADIYTGDPTMPGFGPLKTNFGPEFNTAFADGGVVEGEEEKYPNTINDVIAHKNTRTRPQNDLIARTRKYPMRLGLGPAVPDHELRRMLAGDMNEARDVSDQFRKGYADGGAPYGGDYFDNTFYAPIVHDAQSYPIAASPAALNAYAMKARGHGPGDTVDYVPMPRPRPAGIAPVELPPEITAGTSRPGPRRAMAALPYDAEGEAAPMPVADVISANGASPLDDAPWPAGPKGAPSGGFDANASLVEQLPKPPVFGEGDDFDTSPPARGVAPNGVDWSGNSKLWPSLIAAGFGMMSSKSPFPGVAIGEGGLAGTATYAAAKREENQQKLSEARINLEVKKLKQSADQHAATLALHTKPYSEMTVHEKEKLKEDARYHDLLANRMNLRPNGTQTKEGHPVWVDQRTGQSFDSVTGEPLDPATEVVPVPRGVTRTMTPLEIDREARMRASQEFTKPRPDDMAYIGKPGAFEKALEKYARDIEGARIRHENELRTRYQINPGAPGAHDPSAVPGPTPAPAAPAPPVSAAPAPTKVAEAIPPAPPRPANVPAGAKAQYNRSARAFRWVMPDGTVYSASGERQ